MKVLHQKKDPYAGKTWIRSSHLEDLKKGEEIKVIHKGKFAGEMILTKAHVFMLEKNRSKFPFKSMYDGQEYYTYGVWWKPIGSETQAAKKEAEKKKAVDIQGSLFNN